MRCSVRCAGPSAEGEVGNLFQEHELCVVTVVDPRFKLVPFNTVKHQHSAACCKCYIVSHRKSDIWIAFSRQQWSRVYTSDTTFTGVNVVYLGQTSCECRRISSYCSVQCWRPSQPLDTYLAGTNPSLHVDLLSWW